MQTYPATPEEYEEYQTTMQAMSEAPAPATKPKFDIGVFVKISNLILLVEEIDELYFTGSDADGEEYTFRIDQIDAIIP